MEEQKNNIILFPADRIVRPDKVGRPKSLEEIQLNIDVMSNVHVNEALENIMPSVLNRLEAAGFDVATENDVKDGAFLVEAFRSLLLKYYNIEHPFQTLADKIFEQDADGGLRIAGNITLDLTPK